MSKKPRSSDQLLFEKFIAGTINRAKAERLLLKRGWDAFTINDGLDEAERIRAERAEATVLQPPPVPMVEYRYPFTRTDLARCRSRKLRLRKERPHHR